MFPPSIYFQSKAFYGAQSIHHLTPPHGVFKSAPSFYFCERACVIGKILAGPVGFYLRKLGSGAVDADSLAEGCDEREEGDLEHNL